MFVGRAPRMGVICSMPCDKGQQMYNRGQCCERADDQNRRRWDQSHLTHILWPMLQPKRRSKDRDPNCENKNGIMYVGSLVRGPKPSPFSTARRKHKLS